LLIILGSGIMVFAETTYEIIIQYGTALSISARVSLNDYNARQSHLD
jgi:hypothetical protein